MSGGVGIAVNGDSRPGPWVRTTEGGWPGRASWGPGFAQLPVAGGDEAEGFAQRTVTGWDGGGVAEAEGSHG